MRPDLRAYARRQAGLVSCRQALLCGYDKEQVRRLVRSGRWVRVRRGAYVERAVWDAADPRQRHLLAARAALLAVADESVASHDTAALAHGLPDWGLQLDVVSLTRPGPRTPRIEAGVRHHLAALPPAHAGRADAMPVTSPARTALDVARARGFEAGLVCADAALHAGTHAVDLRRVADVMRQWPGAAAASAVAHAADGRAESPGETLTRIALQEMGFHVESQVELPEIAARVDFRLVGHRVVVEFDGRSKYASVRGSGDGRILWEEKWREDRIRELGYEVVRLCWADLFGHQRITTERRIRAAVARASRSHRVAAVAGGSR